MPINQSASRASSRQAPRRSSRGSSSQNITDVGAYSRKFDLGAHKSGGAAGVLLRSAKSYGVKRIPTPVEFTEAIDREHLAAIKLTPAKPDTAAT